MRSTQTRFAYPGPPAAFANQVRELLHHRELLVPVKRAGVREHLDPDVVAFAIDVGEGVLWKVVDEPRRVLPSIAMSGTCSMVISVRAQLSSQ